MAPKTQSSSGKKEPSAGESVSARKHGLRRRDVLAFSLGVWLSTAGSVVLGSTRTDTRAHWSGEPGLLIGLLLVAPFIAFVLTLLFKGWLAFRSEEGAKTGHQAFVLPLAAGLVCIPVCLAVIAILPKRPMNLFEMLGMAAFFGAPIASAEAYLRLSLAAKDRPGDRS
jgi:hypothetical protein